MLSPTPLERDVAAELTTMRGDPAGYARRLGELAPRYQGAVLFAPGDTKPVMTVEGVSALREATGDLYRKRALPPLTRSAVLIAAAREFAQEQGRLGAVGHRSAGGEDASARVRRHGGDGGQVAETISYGSRTGTDVVRQLLVDDGVPSRAHRRLLLDQHYTRFGVGCAPHRAYRAVCVVLWAGSSFGPG